VTFRWLPANSPFDERPFRRIFRKVSRPVPENAEIVTAYTDGQVTLRSNRDKKSYHEAADLSGFQGVRAGDFVVHGLDILRGSVGVSESDGAISSVCSVCVPVIESDPRFFAYAMRAQAWSGVPRALAKGVREGGADFRRWETLAELPLPNPALTEQRAIADYLDAETNRIDALITKKQQLVHVLEERWSATIDTVIDDLPGPYVPLRRFVRLITQGVSPQAGNLPYSSGERGLLKLSAVRFGEFRPSENKELDADFDFSRAIVPGRGDLLVTRANTPHLVGDACAVRDPDPNVVLCDLIYLLRLDGRLTAEFAAYVLICKRSRRELSSLARGTSQSMVKLRGEDVVSVRVPAPSVRVQDEVVRQLDSRGRQVGGATDRLRHQIDLISEHRQALITAAVTGDFRVPGATW
jgi:type I restriction enzyme, S subunit